MNTYIVYTRGQIYNKLENLSLALTRQNAKGREAAYYDASLNPNATAICLLNRDLISNWYESDHQFAHIRPEVDFRRHRVVGEEHDFNAGNDQGNCCEHHGEHRPSSPSLVSEKYLREKMCIRLSVILSRSAPALRDSDHHACDHYVEREEY